MADKDLDSSVFDNQSAATQPYVARFTPGPWVVTTCCDYWVEPAAGLKDGEAGIALCGDISWPDSNIKQQEWEANARLIAAAPELYEALLSARNLLRAFIGPDNAFGMAALVQASAVLAKAVPATEPVRQEPAPKTDESKGSAP